METILQVKDLKVYYRHPPQGAIHAVDGVSFDIERGDTLGIVGESGCGKTTVAKSLLRILPDNGYIAGGSILLEGIDLTRLSETEMRKVRWDRISMIPQNALDALDPVYRVEDQLLEVINLHRSMNDREASQKIRELFDLVGIDIKRKRSYPHELSGGMKQRVFIAMALILNPGLIIADEPTTALDVIVKDRILEGIVDLQRQFEVAMIYISHDLSVVAETCHHMAVMYGGKIMERGKTENVFYQPCHPYTIGLINAFPTLREERTLISIPGFPPDLINPPFSCRFAERCPFNTQECLEREPALEEIQPGHFVACHRWPNAEEFRTLARREETWVKG
jgi:peptide/nickel transport system ATP-binding protein